MNHHPFFFALTSREKHETEKQQELPFTCTGKKR
jgi:hypothetical protein